MREIRRSRCELHPTVGEITVDCDHLYARDTDLKIVAMTAPIGSEDASKIELARITAFSHAS